MDTEDEENGENKRRKADGEEDWEGKEKDVNGRGDYITKFLH